MGAFALMAGLWTLWPAARKTAPPAALSPVPFTTFSGLEGAPTFSPDGSQIAFAGSPESQEDQDDLYVKVIGSEKALRLTTGTAGLLTPSWSPDGRQIAFARAGRERGGIFVVPALGGPERKLADAEFSYFLELFLSWSPDGTLLAYTDIRRDHQNIVLLNTATLDSRPLRNPSKDCAWALVPVFAPDGRSLAVACTVTIDVNDLYIIPVTGGTGRHVARVEGEFSGMTWTGDGKSIVYASDGELRRVALANGAVQKLLSGRDAAAPTISRDGRRLAFEQGVENINLWQVRLAAPTRPDGLPLKLISSSRRQRNAAFSPDGRRVAFDSNRSGTNEIWVADADGSNASALTSFGGPLTGSPDWSSDGRYIAFESKAGGHSGLYVVSSDGGPVRHVQTGLAHNAVPKWSVDGRWLYFAARAVGRDHQVFKVPAKGGTAVAVTDSGAIADLKISRDGARIYFFHGEAIWSIPTTGGGKTRVSGIPRIDEGFGSAWAPALGGIYFINPKVPAGIDFLNFASERVVRVTELAGKPAEWAGLTLSPDGRRLLYAQRDSVVSDIMLIDNFQ